MTLVSRGITMSLKNPVTPPGIDPESSALTTTLPQAPNVHIRIYYKNHTCVSVPIVICVEMRGDPQQAIMRYAALVGEHKSPAAWRMLSH
jgi:hypothetical protein